MTTKKTSFEKAMDELLDEAHDLSRRSLQEFSDIDPASLKMLMAGWPRVKPERRRLLLDKLQDVADNDTLVCFDDFARAMLTDDDSQVRARAIRLLAECDDAKLAASFIKILASDDDVNTRTEAAFALGKYVELGELEEIPEKTRRQVEDALLEKVNSEDKSGVRRVALEALGYSSRPEVLTLIESSFRREDPEWQASALRAMGNSSDERWEEQVISHMLDVNPHVRLAAVEAAGDLGLSAARMLLFKVLEDEDDDDVVGAAIWSLSQIGGEDVRIFIENLIDRAEDDEQTEFLEDALDNLAFTEDMSHFDLMSFDADEEE
ncbi:MAG: HEAT repeat domain-containing protein [Chloroflexi bacterium]|nr:HEAT repeat domain-containing protein [Chloroflexota bacterium]